LMVSSVTSAPLLLPLLNMKNQKNHVLVSDCIF
jgi:hypothetical protein